jgi:hypothetical protein
VPAARPARLRRLTLALLGSALLVCAGLGGAAWKVLACDRGNYLANASASWLNGSEEYLFACGTVWHSLDTGRTWKQLPSTGLPRLLREGRIAADRTAGRLYLAVLLAGAPTLRCPLCLLTRVEPAMFLSEDGGLNWVLIRRFPEGPAGLLRFRAIYADPDYSDAAWVILATGERSVYYATNTGGREWRQTCVEIPPNYCDPPDLFLEWNHVRHDLDEYNEIIP